MRIGLTVDSSCDLPREWLDEHHVVVLPTTVKIENTTFADERDPIATLRFYRETLGTRAPPATTIPASSSRSPSPRFRVTRNMSDAVFCVMPPNR